MDYINKINNNLRVIGMFIIIIYMISLSGCVSETSRSSLITIAISSSTFLYDIVRDMPILSASSVNNSLEQSFFRENFKHFFLTITLGISINLMYC